MMHHLSSTVCPRSYLMPGPDRRILLLTASALLFGCQPSCETEGLSDLFDTSPTFVRFPGRQLAKGRYDGLWLDGSVEQHGFVLARDLDDHSLTIIPFDGRDPCTVGPVARYWSFLQAFGLQQFQGYVPFIESVDETSRGELQLATFDCQLSGVSLSDAGGPVRPAPAVTPPAYLAKQGGTTLFRLDPWNDEQSVVAEQVGRLEFDGQYLWTIEGGEVVVRDRALNVQGRYGTGAIELLVWSSGRGYFTDQEGLHKVSMQANGKQANEKEGPLVEGACGIATPRGGSSAYVATLAPCAQSQLVLVGTETDLPHILADNAALGVHVSNLKTQEYLTYVTDVDPSTGLGSLWTVTLGGKPVRIGTGASLGDVKAPYNDRLPIVFHADGEPSRLSLWSPDGIVEVAQRVNDVALPFVLHQYDGVTGTLSVLQSDDELEELATGVPALGSTLPDYRATLADFDGRTGTLILITSSADGSYDVEPLASGVPSPGYLFLRFADAISYLKDVEPDAGFGRLEIRFFSTQETYGVDGVSEWMAMDWPDVGVVYSVVDGDRSGIWFGAFQ